MSKRQALHLFTTPPGAPFLKSLVRAVLGGGFPQADSPAPSAHDLGDWRIYVPTRRAAGALREAFVEETGGALLLPRILPLGDPDEDELLLGRDAAMLEADLAELPPSISAAERRLVLMRLIRRWDEALGASELTLGGGGGGHAASQAQAAQLAGELARLMDEVDINRCGWSALHGIVPESLAGNWQLTLEFLKIVTEHWPAHLEQSGLMSPMERRNLLIEARTKALIMNPPPGPVIAAGSTGSVPATAGLLRAVAGLPQGAVVLPGLDRQMDEASWAALGPDHPQFGMKHLLEAIEAGPRGEIPLLPGCHPGAAAKARERLISELMRPAERTHQWAEAATALPPETARQALDGIELIAAADLGEEARIIAMIMRGLLETPGRSGALVTPDRTLARRVAAELGRWGIAVDSSSGTPLRNTPAGGFLLLILEAAGSNFAPQQVLALIKHRLFRPIPDRSETAAGARVLDLALRGIGALPGLDGLAASLTRAEREARTDHHDHPARKRLRAADWAAARALIRQLQSIFAPLAGPEPNTETALAELLVVHADIAARLSCGGAPDVWGGQDGESAAAFLAGLHEAAGGEDRMNLSDYAALIDVLMRDVPVRPRRGGHKRLFIWGTLEARLMQADVMILGGLNEGVWPAVTRSDPWLPRAMRTGMGLEPLERRIGLAAHDFTQFLAAPRVYLTRAEKVDGAPSVPSRWLLRLQAVLGGLGQQDGAALAPAEPWTDWSRELIRPQRFDPRPAPAPRPEVDLRPSSLSVTEIEKWIRDPYEIYALHVLKLQPLDEIAAEPDARHKGIVIHRILQEFAEKEPPGALDEGAEERLLAIATHVFDELRDWPDLQAYWRIRFADIAAEYIALESEARAAGVDIFAEKAATLAISGPHRDFTLRARADRIDIDTGGAVIIDYKTGQPPSPKMVELGLAPQLPLEAAMLAGGAFKGLPAARTESLVYLQLKGGKPAVIPSDISKSIAAMDLAGRALDDLKMAIALYERQDTPYLVRRMTQFENRFTPYDHLARTKEWRLVSGDGEAR